MATKDLNYDQKLTKIADATSDIAGIITGSTEQELEQIISGIGV